MVTAAVWEEWIQMISSTCSCKEAWAVVWAAAVVNAEVGDAEVLVADSPSLSGSNDLITREPDDKGTRMIMRGSNLLQLAAPRFKLQDMDLQNPFLHKSSK